MNKKIVILVMMLCSVFGLKAQEAVEHLNVRVLMDTIASFKSYDGSSYVTIDQDERITTLLEKRPKKVQPRSYSVIRGYRVQVYSSNDPKTGKSHATAIKQRMTAAYPMQNVYLVYQSPSWKVRIGDFSSRSEALPLSNQIKNDFPSIRGDIYIVPDNIQGKR